MPRMPESPHDGRSANGGAVPKTRPDDRRGAPKGHHGNPPFIPTDAQRQEVETMAKVADEGIIATILGISRSTLTRHFRTELDRGQAQAVVTVGGKLLQKALGGHSPSINFYLATRGKGSYSRRLEVTGRDGGAFRHVDLTRFLDGKTEDELALLEPFIEQLIAESAAGADDVDGGADFGPAADQGAPG